MLTVIDHSKKLKRKITSRRSKSIDIGSYKRFIKGSGRKKIRSAKYLSGQNKIITAELINIKEKERPSYIKYNKTMCRNIASEYGGIYSESRTRMTLEGLSDTDGNILASWVCRDKHGFKCYPSEIIKRGYFCTECNNANEDKYIKEDDFITALKIIFKKLPKKLFNDINISIYNTDSTLFVLAGTKYYNGKANGKVTNLLDHWDDDKIIINKKIGINSLIEAIIREMKKPDKHKFIDHYNDTLFRSCKKLFNIRYYTKYFITKIAYPEKTFSKHMNIYYATDSIGWKICIGPFNKSSNKLLLNINGGKIKVQCININSNITDERELIIYLIKTIQKIHPNKVKRDINIPEFARRATIEISKSKN